MQKLCKLFGKTRHAYYDKSWRIEEQSMEHEIVLQLVASIRKEMPYIGTEKLYYKLQQPLKKHNIKMGRDALHELLYAHGLTVRRRRRRVKTTNSYHRFRKYPNLIREIYIDGPEQLWVCDITYISTKRGFNYLSLITDAYSRKIIGYYLGKTLEAIGPINALLMALKSRTLFDTDLIHHSDRGIQYCSNDYVEMLIRANINISMTEKGDPYENAIAERVNGILKTEFDLSKVFQDHKSARIAVEQSVRIYNEERPHSSCNFFTPQEAHLKHGKIPMRWKKWLPDKVRINNQMKE